MDQWLLNAVLASAEAAPDEMRGWALGRGLPAHLFDEMRIGSWVIPDSSPSDESFEQKNGPRGKFREDWFVTPYWGPRGNILGVEFRTWGSTEKKVRDYRLPNVKNVPTFIGLTQSTLQKIWDGGDVWLVEGVFDLAISHALPEKDVALACGTARLTKSQIAFLVRFLAPGAMVHVAFDGDLTGRNQTHGYVDEKTGKHVPGVLSLLDRAGLKSRDVTYTGGKDPGELWEKGGKSFLRSSIGL